jgi:hypothetical protein
MGLKRLGAADLAASTETLLYSVPPSHEVFAAVNLCNRSSEPRSVRLAITLNTTPTVADWLEFGVELQPGETLLREGITLEASGRIYAWASGIDVAAVAYGNEGDAT